MGAVLGVLRFIGVKGAALIGLGGYLYSKSEDGAFAKTVDEKLLPDIGDIGKKIADGATKTVTGLAENVGAQDAIKGAAETSNSVLGKLPGVVSGAAEGIPNAAGKVGDAAAAGLEVGHNTISNFMSKIVPEGWGGFATKAAIGAAALFGLHQGWGGEILKKFAGSVVDIPSKLIGMALGGVGSFVTPIAYVGGALALGYFLLHPHGREMISDAFNGIKNLFNKDKSSPAAEHGHDHAPAQEHVPAVKPEPKHTHAMPDLNGISLVGVEGGEHTTSIARQDIATVNPRRDLSNATQYSQGA